MATIKEVAKLAGVSIATVSRVINQSSRVKDETAHRIEQAMSDLNYRIEGNKRLQINQGESAIALILSSINTPFFGLLSQGVEKIASKYGRKLVVSSGQYDAVYEEETLNYFLDKGFKNIILHCKAMSDESLLKYVAKEPGIILINRYIEEVEAQCIWLDNQKGGYLATKHLLEQGHRNIAHITVDQDISDKRERIEGYKRALLEFGVTPNPDWTEEVQISEKGAILGATNLLNKGAPITAVVAYNDFFAASAIQAFKEHDIKVPEEISVVGFDNTLPQCYFSPKLTTVHNPIESMAMNAAKLSLDGLDSPVSKCFKPLLKRRESVCRIN